MKINQMFQRSKNHLSQNKERAIFSPTKNRGHYILPTQTTNIGEIPQNYHTFALFDPSKMGPI